MSGLLHCIQRTVPTLLLLLSLALAVQQSPAYLPDSSPPPSSSSLPSSSSHSAAPLLYPSLKSSPATSSTPHPLLSSKITSSSSSSSSSYLSTTSSSSSQLSSTYSSGSSKPVPTSNDVDTTVAKESVSTLSDSSDVMTVSANGNRGSSRHSAKTPQSTSEVYMSRRDRFMLTASAKDKKLLESVEKVFLKNAGLSGRPKITPEYAVPEYMLDIYKQQQVKRRGGSSTFLNLKGNNGHIEANTVRSFVHEDIESTNCRPPLCSRVHFDVSTVPHGETLAGAELRIYVDTKDLQGTTSSKRAHPADGAVSKTAPKQTGDGRSYRVEIHEIMRPSSRDDGDVISRLLDTKSLSTRHNSTWQSFDIHPALVRWKRGSEHNHGLEIRLVSNAPSLSTDNHIRVRRSAEMPVSEWAIQRPILVAFTNDGSMPASSSRDSSKSRLRRLKRSSKNKRRNRRKNRKRRKRKRKDRRKKKGNKNVCSVHKLYVDFDDVGWDDWIVAPSGYKANYCHGDCNSPLPIFAKASNHAIVQARVYIAMPGTVPMVCCVPITMSATSMLYRDEKGRTVLKTYHDMTVERCGCK